MATISQRNTGSVWDKRARYIEQSTSALQRYVAFGDEMARSTKMKEYTPQQAREADVSLYNRLLSDEQRTGPGRMPERSSGTAHTSETTGWGRRHLAISGVSHQPLVQTAHHANASGPGGSGVQDNGGGVSHQGGEVYESLRQQDTSGPSSSTQAQFQNLLFTSNPYEDQGTPVNATAKGKKPAKDKLSSEKKKNRKNQGKAPERLITVA
jgi:hypothetical protein